MATLEFFDEAYRRTTMSRLTHGPYLSSCILIVATLTAVSCADHRVHYVLPDGYVGVIKIVLDEKNGLEPKAEHGTYTLNVPYEGVLRLKSFQIFDPWYELIVTEKGGKQIPTAHASDDVIAYRDTIFRKTSNGPDMAITVIGTQKQTDQMREDLANQSFVDVEPALYNLKFRNQ